MQELLDILNNAKDDIKLRSNSFIESERIKIRPLKLEELRDITFKDFVKSKYKCLTFFLLVLHKTYKCLT